MMLNWIALPVTIYMHVDASVECMKQHQLNVRACIFLMLGSSTTSSLKDEVNGDVNLLHADEHLYTRAQDHA